MEKIAEEGTWQSTSLAQSKAGESGGSEDKTLLVPGNVPEELKALKRWVCWKLIPIKDKKPSKVPYNPVSGKAADSTDPKTWSSFERAFETYLKGGYNGIGFMLGYEESNGLNYAGIDLDLLDTPEKWDEPLATVKRFDSYSEISPSRKGLHILVVGKLREDQTRCKETKKHKEVFDHARYFTVTGWRLEGSPATVNQRESELRAFHDEVFGPQVGGKLKAKNAPATRPAPATNAPDKDDAAANLQSSGRKAANAPAANLQSLGRGAANVPAENPPDAAAKCPFVDPRLSDEEILEKARNAKNGEKFIALFDQGDIDLYSGDESAADMGLMCQLAFYTRDEGQLERLFSQSALGEREKWTSRADYRERTIEAALAYVTEAWSPGMQRTYPWTAYGNADRLVDKFGENLYYRILPSKNDRVNGQWLHWNGSIWKPDNSLEIERLAREIIEDLYMEAKELRLIDEERGKKALGFAMKTDNPGQLRAMLQGARSHREVAISSEKFDVNPRLLGLPGEGVVLELTDEGYQIREARKGDLVSRSCGVLPAAREDPRQPDKWLAFLDMIFGGDEELIRYVQKLMGYSLLGSQEKQLFVLFYGEGANGKSTLLRVWSLVLGGNDNYAVYANKTTFSKKYSDKDLRPDLRTILRARVVVVVEGTQEYSVDETLINTWTGGEPITARDLYESTVSEYPQGLLVIAGNHLPVINATTHGIWRRVRMVPFNVKIDDLIPSSDLNDRYAEDVLFAEESDLILRWMLEGYDLYRSEGLISPLAVVEATEGYREESNSVLRFARDTLTEDLEAKISVSELRRHYADYCVMEGIEIKPDKQLRSELKVFFKIPKSRDHNANRTISIKKSRTLGRYWQGIRLKTDLDYETDERMELACEEASNFFCKVMLQPVSWDNDVMMYPGYLHNDFLLS